MDDNSLMARVIAGEIERAGLLYEKYKRPLYAYFFRLTGGNNQASEDLVRTVFYRVIRYRTSFTGKGSFAKWLFRIAHNAGIDYNRGIIRANNYKAEVNTSGPEIYENKDLENDEQHAALEKAMSRLKPDERELIVLGKINCLKYKEIADILNISESNVKIRLFRTLRRLKDIYKKLENTKYEKA